MWSSFLLPKKDRCEHSLKLILFQQKCDQHKDHCVSDWLRWQLSDQTILNQVTEQMMNSNMWFKPLNDPWKCLLKIEGDGSLFVQKSQVWKGQHFPIQTKCCEKKKQVSAALKKLWLYFDSWGVICWLHQSFDPNPVIQWINQTANTSVVWFFVQWTNSLILIQLAWCAHLSVMNIEVVPWCELSISLFFMIPLMVFAQKSDFSNGALSSTKHAAFELQELNFQWRKTAGKQLHPRFCTIQFQRTLSSDHSMMGCLMKQKQGCRFKTMSHVLSCHPPLIDSAFWTDCTDGLLRGLWWMFSLFFAFGIDANALFTAIFQQAILPVKKPFVFVQETMTNIWKIAWKSARLVIH